jgi:hypothetical protein
MRESPPPSCMGPVLIDGGGADRTRDARDGRALRHEGRALIDLAETMRESPLQNQAFAHDGPVPDRCGSASDRSWCGMPPSVNVEMAKGFTLYMLKAVMSGRADELIDLAETNVWR